MKTETVQLSSIPEEIIVYEILKRLPVNTLCRFKAVSKRWLSVITSRPFIDSHFQYSNLNPTCLFGFYNKDTTTTPTFFSKNYPQTSSYNWPDTDYRWCTISPRGLICFYGSRKDTAAVEIWNPSTGEHIELNLPPHNSTTTSTLLFLGFDPVSEKHKLLLISSSSNGENYVITLGENKWRKMFNSSSNNLTPMIGENCCIDGIVYYLAQQRDQNEDDDDEFVLVRFDVGSECFIEPIRLPEELVLLPIEYDSFTLGIYIYRGRVLLLNYDHLRTNGFQMWMLENRHKWSPKRLIPWSPPSPGIYNVGFIDGKGRLLFYSSELDPADSEAAIFRLCSYDLEKGSCWKETTFPDLRKKLAGSARYEVRHYNYVDTLESLKSFSIEQEDEEDKS